MAITTTRLSLVTFFIGRTALLSHHRFAGVKRLLDASRPNILYVQSVISPPQFNEFTIRLLTAVKRLLSVPHSCVHQAG